MGKQERDEAFQGWCHRVRSRVGELKREHDRPAACALASAPPFGGDPPQLAFLGGYFRRGCTKSRAQSFCSYLCAEHLNQCAAASAPFRAHITTSASSHVVGHAFDKLSGTLRALSGLPLAIRSIQVGRFHIVYDCWLRVIHVLIDFPRRWVLSSLRQRKYLLLTHNPAHPRLSEGMRSLL